MPPFPVTWVQTFEPATPKINEIISKINNLGVNSSIWKGETKVVGISKPTRKNLGDLLLKKKQIALATPDSENKGASRCTPAVIAGTKRLRGRPCQACDMMSEKAFIRSHVNSKTFRAPEGTCKWRCLIYCAECRKCSKQCVGQTTRELRQRISGHRSHVGRPPDDTNSDDSSLAEHLKSCHGEITTTAFNRTYMFTILEIEPGNLNTAEQKWVSQLPSLSQMGLNQEKPLGVVNSFLSLAVE